MINETINFGTIKGIISKEIFPNLYTTIQAAITLPVSSITREHSFSAMRRMNNYL